MNIDTELQDYEAAGSLAEELPYWGWLDDERTCLTRAGELMSLARISPSVLDGQTPQQLDRVIERWQRMLSGLDARTRFYFYLLRRPIHFPELPLTGASKVVTLGQRKRREFLTKRVQDVSAYVAWAYDPGLSTVAAARTGGPRWMAYVKNWMARRRNAHESVYLLSAIEAAGAAFRQTVDASRALVDDLTPVRLLKAHEASEVLSELTNRPGTPWDGATGSGMNWRLTIPERGLYTGIAIFGAVGSGKTSACMHPFAKQLLSWQAGDPEKRAAALMLEVKGDFCHDIRSILDDAGRGDDYLEIGMGGLWKWNPLSAWWLDSYSLAYTVASLLNQLFGKGKEPFWQQAYTNLVRWIIELHRVLPEQWVTLQQVYQCAIDPDLFAAKIKQAEAWSAELNSGEVFLPLKEWSKIMVEVGEWQWLPTEGETGNEMWAKWSPALEQKLKKLAVQPRMVWEPSAGDDVRERVAAVKRWFENDWQKLDNKIKSSIVEGVSVFLSMFDMLDVAAVFCPPPPEVSDDPRRIGPTARAAILADAKAEGQGEDSAEKKAQESRQWPAHTIAERPRYLPPLYKLIEQGKVLALNMPAGSNPALARAIGVMLKNAWLQALLMRPAQMKESPSTYFRPAVFICDEYQSFASVGEDDPTGDEKSFALTRQCRCISIVATQSISSLRAVLGSSEAWRALLQTLRTRIFLSLSDDASAKIASELCGQVAKIKGSYTISETSKRAGVSPLSGRAGGSGGGSIGATKSFQERREAVFHPRDFALLGNCQAICLPYDGAQSLEPRRVYLKPHYLPLDHSYWRAKKAGQI